MDLYAVLGVRQGASAAEIRRAYQKRARSLHPDLNPGDPVAAERFRAVSQAFEILSDPHRRAQYDRGDVLPAAPPALEVGFAGFDFSTEVRVDGPGLRDLLDGVLRTPRAEEPARGEDLEQSARISFQESFLGARRRLQILRYERCEACEGQGRVSRRPQSCPACKGSGHLRAAKGRMLFTRRCADCGGQGVIGEAPCARCQGEGRAVQSEWIEVVVPPGVDSGSRVRLPGAGNAGRRGGPAGDLVLHVEVDAHPLFRREGADLQCEVPVTFTEAALGAHIEVPTLESPVVIEVPAGTQNGQRFRLRKRGMPRPEGGRGDLFVSVRVQVPAVTDEPSRQLLREFERRHPEEPRRDLLPARPAAKAR